jgi:hypothetical protein
MSSEERKPYLIYVELHDKYFMKLPDLTQLIRKDGTKDNRAENNIGLCGFETERDLTNEEIEKLTGLLTRLRDDDKRLKIFEIKEKVKDPNPD